MLPYYADCTDNNGSVTMFWPFVALLPYYADFSVIYDPVTMFWQFVTMLPYFTFNERSYILNGGDFMMSGNIC
jgi:hypothetical protein